MNEIAVKTHLIITNIYSEYEIEWFGKMAEIDPLLVNNKPVFIVIGGDRRVEMNTTNMVAIEDCAKRLSNPKGRTAITKDTVSINIKEKNGNEKRIGKLVHRKIKEFAPMFDKVGYQN